MKTKITFFKQLVVIISAFVFIAGCGKDGSELSIIPEPEEIEVQTGQFEINKLTKIIVDSDDPKVEDVAEFFIKQFNSASGFSLKAQKADTKNSLKNSIIFSDKDLDSSLGDEGYTLTSDKDNITLTGTPHGLFYGVQTLLQLLPAEVFSSDSAANVNWSIPAVEIKDKPRFKWRGMHLDVGRHMFTVSFIKKYIDYIAMHKLNTFHWHLTEDQ